MNLRTLERCLFVTGCACSAYLLANMAGGATFFRPVIREHLPVLEVVSIKAPGLFARLQVPALHLSLPVVEGTDSIALRKAIGHIPGTAMPGGLGNVGLAGHRDTYFRPLRNIAKGMEIILADGKGEYYYSVESMEIVSPDAVRILDISSVPELTLITCFPFDFVGSAPKRFIVHARLKSAAAASR